MRIVLAVCAGLFWLQAQAAAPVIATIDRSVWPERLETPGLFDVASRAEILAFAHELYLSEKLDEEGLKQRLGLRFVNVPSLNVVRHRLWLRLLENYQNAQKSCEQDANFCVLVEDMDQLRQRAEEYQVSNDSFYANWARPSAAFHQRYLNELLFMAALFPQTSSEIERYNSDEMSGDEMPDRTFMLNFESGPSPADGGTDWLADFMRQQKMTATFFVLGKSLQERLESTSVAGVQALYRQQCVGIRAGSTVRTVSGWTGRIQCNAARHWFSRCCRTTSCRCFALLMAIDVPTAATSSAPSICACHCGISTLKTTPGGFLRSRWATVY